MDIKNDTIGTERPVMHLALTLEEGAVLVNSASFAAAAAMGNDTAALRIFGAVVEALNRLGGQGFNALQKRLVEAGRVFEATSEMQVYAVKVPADDTARATTNPFGGAHKNEHVA